MQLLIMVRLMTMCLQGYRAIHTVPMRTQLHPSHSTVTASTTPQSHLAVPASGSTTLDAKSGALAGLAHTGDNLFVQVGTQGLAQSNSGGALALPQWRGCDARHHDWWEGSTASAWGVCQRRTHRICRLVVTHACPAQSGGSVGEAVALGPMDVGQRTLALTGP